MSLLKAQDLSVVYGTGEQHFTAVDSVSLSVRRGEIVSVVGQFGSGKSTLAHVLAGLIQPTSGEVTFEGEPLHQGRSFWQEVQLVFQDPFAAFNHFYTVERHLLETFFLLDNSYTLNEKRSHIDESLNSVGLQWDKVASQSPYTLTAGEVQRVLLARILLIRPKLLIIDEPTAMVDASQRGDILQLLSSFRVDFGMTILCITHNIGLAKSVSDSILVMNKGQIVEENSTDKIFAKPLHPYTRKLFRDIPVLAKGWLDS